MELTKREYDEKQEELSKVLEDLDKALIFQREAKSFMDFSENSELDAANHQVMLLQKRRSELQEQLNNCEIITPTRGPRIALGNIIRVTEVDDAGSPLEKSREFRIVSDSSDTVIKKTLSIESPLGKSILGEISGVYLIQTPSGGVRYKVEKIADE